MRKKTYSDEHSLLTPKKNAVIVPITEIGIIAPVHDNDDEAFHEKVADVRVISVSNFSEEKNCAMCKATLSHFRNPLQRDALLAVLSAI